MTLSWKELVRHGLLNQIKEPVVVKYILKMAIKERCVYLSEEAREFHTENIESFLHYIRLQNMFVNGEEVILSELPPMEARMFAISHNKVIYEIVLKYRKKHDSRSEREKRRRSEIQRWDRWRADGSHPAWSSSVLDLAYYSRHMALAFASYSPSAVASGLLETHGARLRLLPAVCRCVWYVDPLIAKLI